MNKSLRRLWVAAGYHEKMGSAEVLPPPGGGFRRLYHQTTAEYAISNIVFHRIKVARLMRSIGCLATIFASTSRR